MQEHMQPVSQVLSAEVPALLIASVLRVHTEILQGLPAVLRVLLGLLLPVLQVLLMSALQEHTEILQELPGVPMLSVLQGVEVQL